MDPNNLAFLLTPKAQVEYLFGDFTIRQALEKMGRFRYASIPVLDRESGAYLYSLSEGDLLWTIKDLRLSFNDFQRIPIAEVKRYREVPSYRITTPIEDLYLAAMGQNFVPITDDRGLFIGIVTRKKVISAILSSGLKN